jgi:hypothetical protein
MCPSTFAAMRRSPSRGSTTTSSTKPNPGTTRVGFIVTNLGGRAKRVVNFYNGRGTAEQWIKEGKHAVRWTRLSCHDFDDNQVRQDAPRLCPPLTL